MTTHQGPPFARLTGFRVPVLTTRERDYVNRLAKNMTPRLVLTADGCTATPRATWYATYCAISGWAGIEPLSRMVIEAGWFVEDFTARSDERRRTVQTWRSQAEAERADGRPNAHRGQRSGVARVLGWVPS